MLRTYLKYLAPWQQFLLFVAIALGVAAIGSLIMELILRASLGYSSADVEAATEGKIKNVMPMRPYLVLSQVSSIIFLFIIPAYLFAYFADPKPAQYLHTTEKPEISFIASAIGLVILGVLATNFLGIVNQYIPFPQSLLDSEKKYDVIMKVLSNAPDSTNLIVNIVVIGFFAAVSEELFFRGVLQRIMIQWAQKPWLGIIITSVLFSAFHFQFSGFLPRMGLGIILGALYWYSGSIYVPILYHFLHNTLGVIMIKYKPSLADDKVLMEKNALAITVAGIAATIAIVFIIQFLKKQSKTKYSELYPPQHNVFDKFH